MDDPFLLWSRVLRGMALILLLCLSLTLPLLYSGWLVVSPEDLGIRWRSLVIPLGFSLLLWLVSRMLQRKARQQE